VKLSSGDPTWWDGTALTYHFETQPLPLWTAWFVHQSPAALLRTSSWLMIVIELIAPWLIVSPRRFRHNKSSALPPPRSFRPTRAAALIASQIAILVTGNYAYFNWLTMGLILLLFDDEF